MYMVRAAGPSTKGQNCTSVSSRPRVDEYIAYIHALKMDIHELSKLPTLNQGTGLGAMRDKLSN